MIDHLEYAQRYSHQPLHLYMDVNISSCATKAEVTVTNAHVQLIYFP